MNSRIHPYTKFIAFILTFILVAILFTQVSITDIFFTMIKINPFFLLAGFTLYIGSYWFRAWRFHILLNNEVSTGDLFYIECVHNMMNNLLPARTGELSYIYLLKKVNTRTTGQGIATLIIARIFDIITLAGFFFCAIILVRDVPAIIYQAIWLIAICIFLLIIILVMLLWYGREFEKWVQKAAVFFHIDKTRGVQFFLKRGDETVDCLGQIDMHNILTYCLFSSLLIWGLSFGMIYLLLAGLGFNLSFILIIIGITFLSLTTLLPIQGIAGFGTTELVWTIVFVPLGLSMDDAIISGFCYHIILIIFFITLGIYGWLKMKM